MIKFLLNDKEIEAPPSSRLLDVIEAEGLKIPHLCFNTNYRPDGNCRSCVVEVAGERTLTPSCCRRPENGMKVYTHSERAESSRKMVLEMLHIFAGGRGVRVGGWVADPPHGPQTDRQPHGL